MEALLYLAKEGKVSGPFTPPQVEEMKSSGEFYNYEWMWDGEAPDWSPVPRKLTTPPVLPEERTKTLTRVPATGAAEPEPTKSAKAPKEAKGQKESRPAAKSTPAAGAEKSAKVFCAVLFDTRQCIGGEVSKAHAGGAHFVSSSSQTTPLSKGSQAFVDLLDETTDRSTKIQATIASVSRMGDRWVMELEWPGCPLL